VIAASVLISRADTIVGWVRNMAQTSPPPPAWLTDLPWVGPHLASTWREWLGDGPDGLAIRIAAHANEIAAWTVGQVGSVGMWIFQLFATLALAGVLYARGERVSSGVRIFARRLAGERGDGAVMLAAKATRAVAFGVLVTGLVQALVGGAGLLAAGVPAWKILTAAMFLTSIAQVGAAPIVGFAALWVFAQGNTGWGIALGAWALLVGSLDNIIRPILIGREAHLPVLMVFAGVIGGLLAFGPVGLFAGPVILAVTDSLLRAWVRGDGSAERPVGATYPPA
jgi:predicted PurR-regulated permease PerM